MMVLFNYYCDKLDDQAVAHLRWGGWGYGLAVNNRNRNIILGLTVNIVVMSQPSSSIISADNAETKYRKALKQISKLITANRVLRESADKNAHEMKEKIDQLSLRYEDMEKEYETVRKEKESLANYLDEIQKERKNLEREVSYLNDVLQEQSAELKKHSMYKDERAVALLIRTYEEKELAMNRNRTQNEDIIAKLKSAIDKLEEGLVRERDSKQEHEEKYRALSLQMQKYKNQNLSLIQQIDRLLKEGSQKDTYCVEKEKQLSALIVEMQAQIAGLKSTQEQSIRAAQTSQVQQYAEVLAENNKLVIELTRVQTAYEELLLRQREFYEMEDKMRVARLQAERANEEVNMLKSKIVVMEAKEFLDEAGDEDYSQKQFQERLNLLIAQNDPLNSIKNQEDTAHFSILKGFIVDLQDKIYKINQEKKQTRRKYKSIKGKFVKMAQEFRSYEQQNKLMRGKIQGYERLTEKLQFQLEKAITNHEQQIKRITITSNNIITRKVEQYKDAISLVNSQLQAAQDKVVRGEKNYKQQIDTLRLELETLKLKYKDETDRLGQDEQIIELYKKKNTELVAKISALEEQIANCTQNLNRFESLFKEQKGKTEGLLVQKLQLISQVKFLTEEADKKSSFANADSKNKENNFDFQIRKLRTENGKLSEQIQQKNRENIAFAKQIDERRRSEITEVNQIRRLTQRNEDLQGKIVDLKRLIRELEDQNETLKVKSRKFQESYDKTNKFEEENIKKTDRINDLTREKISLQSEIKSLKDQLLQERKLNEESKKQFSNLKIKSIDISHEAKKQFELKIIENKKIIQSLQQQISDLNGELREQKSKVSRINSELANTKSERNRAQEVIEQMRKRDLKGDNEVVTLRLEIANLENQIERARAQSRSHVSTANSLNQEIEILQRKVFTLNQQISSLKMRVEVSEDLKSDIVKDLNSIRLTFQEIQTKTNEGKANLSLPWPEQNFYSSLSTFLLKIRRIYTNCGLSVDSSANIHLGTGTPAGALTPKSKNFNDNYADYFKSYANQDSDNKITSSYAQYNYRVIENTNFDNKVPTTESIALDTRFNYNTYLALNAGESQHKISNASESQYKSSFDSSFRKNVEYNFST